MLALESQIAQLLAREKVAADAAVISSGPVSGLMPQLLVSATDHPSLSPMPTMPIPLAQQPVEWSDWLGLIPGQTNPPYGQPSPLWAECISSTDINGM